MISVVQNEQHEHIPDYIGLMLKSFRRGEIESRVIRMISNKCHQMFIKKHLGSFDIF